MESSINQHHKNVATFIHISVFSKYFIPLGNFIAPIVLWAINKDRSDFIDHHGKQALNLQISIIVYHLLLLLILGIPFALLNMDASWDMFHITFQNDNFFWDSFDHIHGNIFWLLTAGSLLISLWIYGIICAVLAAMKANEGIYYKIPFTLNIIK
ncbi:hypothetical protein SAMN05216480_10715 [Pustulibacterium marinum]|uniref:DUF4870 domain-containing protein n=1 Tax=Pustulibacterium marinum TaxID=1224947 RepID=A0A1I7H3J1_9FLAO|nr:DUF4870 domain-containing protein [Pustulibacterium marinum]SFU55275.1 hypothetical protein SAMN05216480_10715 [Pustulibacterium marinum]